MTLSPDATADERFEWAMAKRKELAEANLTKHDQPKLLGGKMIQPEDKPNTSTG